MTGSLLSAGGDLLDVVTTATVESFRRPDGSMVEASPVFDQDGHDVWPVYDPCSIVDGELQAPGVHYQPSAESPTALISARVATTDIGRDDDFTLDMCWRVPNITSAIHQVNPAIGVDLTREGTVEDPCGLVFAWDISIFGGVTYWHRLPKAPTPYDSCLNPAYYTPYYPGTNATFTGYGTGPGVTGGVRYDGDNHIRVRCRDGMIETWWHGHPRHDPVERPSWMDGRTRIGVHIVTLQTAPGWVGYPPTFPEIPLSESMPRITRWAVSPA